MAYKRIILSLPVEMLVLLDEHCQKKHYNRSELFRYLVRGYLGMSEENKSVRKNFRKGQIKFASGFTQKK